MQRDGKNIKGESYDVKNNPLLRAAILEIRDGYFELAASHMIHRFLRRNQELHTANAWNLAITSYEDCEQIVLHNARSLNRLMQTDYGFTTEEKTRILTEASKPELTTHTFPGLSKNMGFRLLGAVIRGMTLSINSVDPTLCIRVPQLLSMQGTGNSRTRSTP